MHLEVGLGTEGIMKYKLIKDIELESGWIIPAGIIFMLNPKNGKYEGKNPYTHRILRLEPDFLEDFGDEYLEEVSE